VKEVAARSELKAKLFSVYEVSAVRISHGGFERTVPAVWVDLDRCRVEIHTDGRVIEYIWHKSLGEVEILQRIRTPRDHLLHAALMSVKYEHVASHQVWHILRLYHRVIMYAFDVEAINEHVGSHIRYIEKHHACGRPLEVRNLIRAVMLRVLHVKGDLTDVAVIQRGLDECFRHSKAKPHLHFLVTDQRTLQKRREGLGPSLTLARMRDRLLRRSGCDFYFPWLLRFGETTQLCKDCGDAAVDALLKMGAPGDLPKDVWDEVTQHLQALRGGLIAGVAMPKLK